MIALVRGSIREGGKLLKVRLGTATDQLIELIPAKLIMISMWDMLNCWSNLAYQRNYIPQTELTLINIILMQKAYVLYFQVR